VRQNHPLGRTIPTIEFVWRHVVVLSHRDEAQAPCQTREHWTQREVSIGNMKGEEVIARIAHPATTITGYSMMLWKMRGARNVLNAPPKTPPTDTNR
jgi:hypothetical protein